MAKKGIEDDQLMDDFEDEGGMGFDNAEELDFAGEEELLIDEEGDEDLAPTVLYKGIARPKTEDDWRQLLIEARREGVPEYRLTDSYKEGELIQHRVFGLGVVSKVISARKMEVVFEVDKKLMAMNANPPAQSS